MKCNVKTMLKVAAVLAAFLATGYWVLPSYRAVILSLAPFSVVLLCPLSMLLMMWFMQRPDEARSGSAPPAKQALPLSEHRAN
jgi:hypothetical protein